MTKSEESHQIDFAKTIHELERWARELDRTATDLQVLRRQIFDLLMQLKTGVFVV